jgi:hypothetical protein
MVTFTMRLKYSNRVYLQSVTSFPTDQVLVARLLADREGCILHSAGMLIDGHGFAFAGHSDAGKSTIVTQLRPYGEILCDDRNILRRYPDGWPLRHLVPRQFARRLAQLGTAARHPAARASPLQPAHPHHRPARDRAAAALPHHQAASRRRLVGKDARSSMSHRPRSPRLPAAVRPQRPRVGCAARTAVTAEVRDLGQQFTRLH